MKNKVIKQYENDLFKITIEEISEYKFITTEWDKLCTKEFDRVVYEYETFGGAASQAFDLLSDWCEVIFGEGK